MFIMYHITLYCATLICIYLHFFSPQNKKGPTVGALQGKNFFVYFVFAMNSLSAARTTADNDTLFLLAMSCSWQQMFSGQRNAIRLLF